jgi:hypothetical protein
MMFVCNDIEAVQNCDFYHIGVLFVLSVAYGSAGFLFMNELIFDYLTTGYDDVSSLELHDIPNETLRCVLEKV